MKRDLDGTLDYLNEIQKGTLRVEQAGSFFDDTFHGQQIIASAPKRHQKDEQPESLVQIQEEKKKIRRFVNIDCLVVSTRNVPSLYFTLQSWGLFIPN